MFAKEINLSKGNTSIISKDLIIKGNLNSDGVLEIEGNIEGDINGNIVTIRETGIITGNIVSKILNVKGKMTGTIKSERINVSGKADIKGTLEYISLCVEDGSSIEGELKRISEVKFTSNSRNNYESKTNLSKDNKIESTESTENKK